MIRTLLILVCVVLQLSTQSPNIDIELGSYLTSEKDSNVVNDVRVSSSGSIYLVGSGNFNYNLKPQPLGSNPTTGFVLEMVNNKPTALYRVGGTVGHVRTGPNDMILISGDFGLMAFNSKQGSTIWSISDVTLASNCSKLSGATYKGANCRIHIGADSNSAALIQVGYYAMLFVVIDDKGNVVSNRTFNEGAHHVNDIAVLAKPKLIAVTYFLQTHLPGGLPVQSPCVEAFDYQQTKTVWRSYCWSGKLLGENQADSRGLLLDMNDDDGYLYFGGECYGGNSPFRFSGTDLSKKINLVGYDAYTQAYNTGSEAITFFSRMDASTGDILLGQFIIGREGGPTGHGNSVSPDAIATDTKGNVYVAQSAACCIDNRGNDTVNGQKCGPYGGDGAILVVSQDFKTRIHWNVFTKSGGSSAVGVGVGGGVTAFVTGIKEEAITVNPLKDTGADKSQNSPYLATFKSSA